MHIKTKIRNLSIVMKVNPAKAVLKDREKNTKKENNIKKVIKLRSSKRNNLNSYNSSLIKSVKTMNR
jgi:hypothetical protein